MQPSGEPLPILAGRVQVGDRLLVLRGRGMWDEPGCAWHGARQMWPARGGPAVQVKVRRVVRESARLEVGTALLIGLFTEAGVVVGAPATRLLGWPAGADRS